MQEREKLVNVREGMGEATQDPYVGIRRADGSLPQTIKPRPDFMRRFNAYLDDCGTQAEMAYRTKVARATIRSLRRTKRCSPATFITLKTYIEQWEKESR